MGTRAALTRKATQLAAQSPVKFYELAGLITALHNDHAAPFDDLAEPLKMGRRRLYYLLEVGRLIARYRVKLVDAENVGWTKLQMIARHVAHLGDTAPPHLQDLIEIAFSNTTHSLPQALRGRRTVKKRAVVFRLSMGARAELNEALLAYGAERTHRGYTGKERALIRIVRVATTKNG